MIHMGMFKSKEEKLERLKKRLEKKGKTPEQIQSRLETRSKLQDVGKGLGKLVAGSASTFMDVVPIPIATVGKVISKVPQLKKVPVLGEVAQVAEIKFDASVQEYGSVPKAILSEFAPLLEDIKNGEYLKAGISIALLAAAGIAFFVLM